jgi:hypothetical protein
MRRIDLSALFVNPSCSSVQAFAVWLPSVHTLR